MKSSAYWQRRFEELEAALLQKGERYNADEVERQFHLTMAEIEKEIARWYQRLGDNNEISAADARKLLSRDELKEFHWTVEEYIKRGRESNYTDKWKKQLENASAKVHITRFEAMKLQLQQQLEVLYGNQVDGLDKLMKDIYTEGFRRSAFTIDTGMGVHYDLSAVNPQRIDTIVKNPWVADGKNFSDRLWRDKDKLVSTLQQEMQNAVARGDKLDTAVKNIAKRMNAAKSSAARLVMTESAFISGKAQRDCFAELGVEEYEFVATLDRKTSEICREHDGKVYKVKDYKPGTNAPPMHCWCRSCIVPYFNDEEGRMGERAARDPDTGKRAMVPADMTYSEWEKKYVNMAAAQDESGSIREQMAMQVNSLTTVEKEKLARYTGFSTQRINNAIYQGKVTKAIQKDIDILDAALEKCIIPEDITVQRKTILQYLAPWLTKTSGLKELKTLVGGRLAREGFTSTTLNSFDYPGRNVIMRLKVPKGYRGAAYIATLANKYKFQDEILFRRGMEYQIESVEEVDGIFYVTGKVLPDEAR